MLDNETQVRRPCALGMTCLVSLAVPAFLDGGYLYNKYNLCYNQSNYNYTDHLYIIRENK